VYSKAVPQMSDTTKPSGDLRNRGPSKSETKAADAKAQEATAAPSFLSKCAQNVGPILTTIGNISDAIQPHLVKLGTVFNQAQATLKQYHLDQFLPALLGLVLAFFGGQFVLTIATVEAFRLGGWEKTRAFLVVLQANYQEALKANREDDGRDDDHDGIPDVKQISKQQLASRKMLLFLKVCDPVKVSEAVNGVTAACCAVLATLRIQFARIVTLGVSIGNYLDKSVERHCRGPLEQHIPAEHHKWIGPGIGYACKTIGISLAWVAGRFLAALQSGLRGGQLFTRALLVYLKRTGYMTTEVDEKDPLFIGIALAVAVAGIWWQLKNFFQIPFPFNLLLFPLSIIEWVLSYVVGDVSTPAS